MSLERWSALESPAEGGLAAVKPEPAEVKLNASAPKDTSFSGVLNENVPALDTAVDPKRPPFSMTA